MSNEHVCEEQKRTDVEVSRLYFFGVYAMAASAVPEGMTDDNKQNDHMMLVHHFDITDPEHVRRCFHRSNYQPLPGKENIAKNKKIIYNMQFVCL